MLRSQFGGHSGFELNEDCKIIEHLRNHLRTHHPREYAKLGLTSKAATPSALASTFPRSPEVKIRKFRF